MRATDLVNARAELVRRLGEPTGSVQGSLHKMVLVLGATAKGDFDEARLMQSMAKLALSYRVSEEMCALTEFAASQLGEEDTFDATLPLSECGLLYFERPIHLGMKGADITDDPELSEFWDSTEASRGSLPIRWLLWGPAQWRDTATGRSTPGIVIHAFYDLLIDGTQAFQTRFIRDDDKETSIADALGRWGYLGAFMIPDRSRIVQTRNGDRSDRDHNGRIVIALFRLLAQVIAITEVEQADPKKLSKTAKRIKLLPQVTTIRLRRQKGVSREPGESMVEWSHRWVCRGHWRNQPYGSREHPEYRRIWIAPHIRGPEDKPLTIRPHLYSLER